MLSIMLNFCRESQFLTKGDVVKILVKCIAFCQGLAVGLMQRSLQYAVDGLSNKVCSSLCRSCREAWSS